MDVMSGNADSRERKLLAHIADLELEVDRLRKQAHFIHQVTFVAATDLLRLPGSEPNGSADNQVRDLAQQLMDAADVLSEPVGYLPVPDQVLAIPLRPLIEQVFKWQQRLHNAPYVALHQELSVESVQWFPVRLRHILDNLISNALRYRKASWGESRVSVGITSSSQSYQLRVADNGPGMPAEDVAETFESFDQSAPTRSARIGVGLPVVKALLEQCGGSLVRLSGDGVGTTFVATLPRYDMDDFLGSSDPTLGRT